MASLLVALRRLREDRAPAIGLGLLVLVTAAVFALAPRLLDRVGNDALHGVVAGAGAAARNIALIDDESVGPGPDTGPLDPFDQVRERAESQIPTSVDQLVAFRSLVADSIRFRIEATTTDPAFVRLRLQPGAEARIHYTAGRAPAPAARTVPLPPTATPQPDAEGTRQTVANVIEVALSADAVRQLGHGLGETLFLTPDPHDQLTADVPRAWAAMEVVGVFAVDDPRDPFWYEDSGLEKASIRSLGGDARAIDTTALLAPSEYRAALGLVGPSFLPFRATWRLFVAPERLDAAGLDPLIRDLRRLDTTFGQVTSRVMTSTAVRSGLLPLIQAHAARWTSALAILTVVAIGPAAAAIAALGLIATLAARRRRPALTLVRGRGATVGQIVRAVVLEGLVITLPALGLAVLATIVLIPTGSNRLTVAVATVVAAATVVLLLVTALPSATATLVGGREDGPPRGPGVRRLVLDGVVVLAAAAGAWLLRERGIRGTSSTGELAAADPLIAAVPALAAIAVGLAAIRLLPLPLRLLGRIARGRRGLVPMLALRRAVQGGTTSAILLVLLAAASIGTFSSAALTHLDRSAEVSSWHVAGAPYRLSDPLGSLSSDLDPKTLPGVRSVAAGSAVQIRIGNNNLRIQFLSIDAAAWEPMIRGTAGDPGLPPALLTPEPGAVLPIVVSAGVAGRPDGVKIGDDFDILVNGLAYHARAVAAIETFPTMAPGTNFAIASRQQLKAIHPEAQLLPTMVFLDAPASADAAIRAAVGAIDSGAIVDGQAALAADFRSSPVTAALIVGIAAAGLVAAIYAALAITAALALAGAARAVEVAHLRTLGLSRREALGLAIVEHGPTVLLAPVAGILLGLGLFALVEPSLGVDALVGSRIAVGFTVDPSQLALILAGVLAIASIGIGLAAWMQRRGAPVLALRRGFE